MNDSIFVELDVHKTTISVAVAEAREMVGFLWAITRQVQLGPAA